MPQAVPTTELDELPYDYVPYPAMELCGNTLQSVMFIVEINGNHPILIGKGPVPYVWLYAPTSRKLSVWSPVVERNTSLAPSFLVSASRAEGVWISGFGTTLLRAHARSETEVVVTEIDLRPIGINLAGDQNGVMAGASLLTGKRVVGSRSFVALR